MFKILCLDGGGSRGYFTAYILKRIEEEFNIKINEYFDLIVGTSTGAIISGSISVGIPINDIVNMYLYENNKIFQKKSFNIGMISSIYSNEYLKKLIDEKLNGKSFNDCKTNLMILSTNIQERKAKIFKSWDNIENVNLLDSILASSAAPVYFDPYEINNELFSDGCLWANNPAVLAIAEAVSKNSFNKDIKDIKVLSIGTGNNIKPFNYNKNGSWGLVTFAKDLITIMIDSSTKSDNDIAINLLDDRYLRINYNIEEKSINKIPKYLYENNEKIFMDNYDKIYNFINMQKVNLLDIRQENNKKYNFLQKFVKKIFKI